MAGATIDTIQVDSKFSPEGFSAGLAASEQIFQQFIQRTTTLSAPVVVDFKLTGVTQAVQQVAQAKTAVESSISPAAFEAFSTATTAAFGNVAAALEGLNVTLAQLRTANAGTAGFFTGLVEGAEQAISQLTALQGVASPVVASSEAMAVGIGQASRALTAATPGAQAWARGLAAVENAQLQAAQSAAALNAEVGFIPQRMAAGNSGTERFAQGLRSIEAQGLAAGGGLLRTTDATEKLLSSGEHGARALRSISQAIALVGFEAIGVQGPLTRAAEGLVLFAGGVGELLLASAVLAGAGLVFTTITEGARAAKEETKQALDALLKLHEAQRDPVRVRLEQTGDAAAKLDELRGKITKLAAEAERLRSLPVGFDRRGGEAAANQLLLIQAQLVTLGQEFAKVGTEAAAGGLDVATQQVHQLADALRLSTASAADTETAAEAIGRFNAEARDSANVLDVRNKKQQESNDLLAGSLAPIQAQLEGLQALREAQAQLGQGRVQLDVGQAVHSLDDLEVQLRRLESSVSAEQRPLVLRLEAQIDVERLQQQLAPALDRLKQLAAERTASLQLGPTVVSFDTKDAIRNLDALDAHLATLQRGATAAERPLILQARVQIDVERTAIDLDPIRRQLADLGSLRGIATADARLAERLGLPAAQADLAVITAEVDKLLAGATGGRRQVLLQFRGQLAQDALAGLQLEVQRTLGNVQAIVRVGADLDPALEAIRQTFGPGIPVTIDRESALAQAEALARDIAQRIRTATDTTGQVPAALAQAFDQVTGSIQKLMDAPVAELIAGAERASNQLDAMLASIEAQRALQAGALDTGANVREQSAAIERAAPLIQNLRDKYTAVTTEIDAGTASTARQIELLREQSRLAEQLRTVTAQAPTPLEVTQLGPLEDAARAFTDAKNRLDLALATGNKQAVAGARSDVDAAARAMDQVARTVGQILQGLGLDAATIKQILDKVKAAYEQTGRSAGQAALGAIALNNAIHETTRGLGGLIEAAANIGLIGSQATQSAEAMLALGDAIGNVIESASTGNILGLASAGLNFVGSIFGKGPGEAERDQILKETNTRLADLVAALDRNIQGVAPLQRAGEAAAFLAPEAGALQTQSVLDQINGTTAAFTLVNQQLARFGLTFDELQAIAKQNGISLLDSQGRIVATQFQKLAEIMGVTIDQMTHFSQSFRDELDFADLKARINGGIGDAGDQFKRDLQQAGAVGSDFVAHFFDGIDFKNKAQFQDRLNKFVDLFGPDSDFFKQHPELLGGLTPEDWRKILNDGASAMDLFNQATKDATKSLGDFNIPSGFREAAFAAAAAIPGGPTLPPLQRQNFEPRAPGFEIASPGTFGSPSTTVTVQAGAIVIHQLPGENQAELAERVVSAFRTKAMATTGDTLDLSLN